MQSPDGIRRAYDTVAEDYSRSLPDLRAEQPLDLAMIAHWAELLPGPRVLEAGCGAGRLLPHLAGLGLDPQGVDLSPEMVRRARADRPAWPVQVADLAALPFADATFDGVIAWYSTIHTPDADLPAVIAELARATRPGGAVLLASQAGTGSHDAGASYRRRGHDVELIRYRRDADALAAALQPAGLVEHTRMQRAAVRSEPDAQAVVIAVRA